MHKLSFNPLAVMADSYLEAALWADGAEHWEGVTTPTKHTKTNALDTCRQFMQQATPYIHAPRDRELFERLGHDLWLTAQGHGTGFWDKPDFYGAGTSEKLTTLAASPAFQNNHVYHAGGTFYGIE